MKTEKERGNASLHACCSIPLEASESKNGGAVL